MMNHLAAACVSIYQVGGVVGTILIGYFSDVFIGQVWKTNERTYTKGGKFLCDSLYFMFAYRKRIKHENIPGLQYCSLTVSL